MPTNPFYAHNNPNNSNEQDLIHGFFAESIQIKGFDFIYLPRQSAAVDDFFGEDVLSNFNESYTIEMYIASAESFEGQGDMMAMFGLLIKDQARLQLAQRRFQEITGKQLPIEGDLIYAPFNNSLLEIKFVEHEHQFYPLMTLPSFELKVELFDYSNEKFETGHTEIDSVEQISNDIDKLDELGRTSPFFDEIEGNEAESEDWLDKEAKDKSIWSDF